MQAQAWNNNVFAWDFHEGTAFIYAGALSVEQAGKLQGMVREKQAIDLKYWKVPEEIVMLDSWQHATRPCQISIYFVPAKQKLPKPDSIASTRGYHGGNVIGEKVGKSEALYLVEMYND